MLLFKRIFQSKVLRNANWLLLGGVATAVISFVTTALVARRLTIEDFGVVQFTLTCFFFVQQSENLIFPNVFKKRLVEKSFEKPMLFRMTIQLMVLISAVLSALFLAIYLATEIPVIFFLSILCAGLIFRAFIGISYALDVELRSRVTLAYNISGLTVGSAMRIISAIVAPGVLLQIIATPVQYFVSCAAHFAKEPLARKELSKIFRFDRELWTQLIKLSFGFFWVSLLSLVLFRIDTFLLGLLSSAEEVGLYSAAVKLSEPWLFIGTAISSSFLPLLVRTRKQGPTKYYTYISLLFWILLGSSTLLAVAVTMFAEPVLSLTFGDKYLSSSRILKVHIWSLIPLFLYSLHHIWDVCEHLDKWAIQRSAFAAACNILLNLALIPKMGAMACAVSSVITYFLYGYGFNLFHRRGRLLLLTELKFLPRAIRIIRSGGTQA